MDRIALTRDALRIVFRFLEPEVLGRIAQVCRMWRDWIDHDPLWEPFVQRDCPLVRKVGDSWYLTYVSYQNLRLGHFATRLIPLKDLYGVGACAIRCQIGQNGVELLRLDHLNQETTQMSVSEKQIQLQRIEAATTSFDGDLICVVSGLDNVGNLCLGMIKPSAARHKRLMWHKPLEGGPHFDIQRIEIGRVDEFRDPVVACLLSRNRGNRELSKVSNLLNVVSGAPTPGTYLEVFSCGEGNLLSRSALEAKQLEGRLVNCDGMLRWTTKNWGQWLSLPSFCSVEGPHPTFWTDKATAPSFFQLIWDGTACLTHRPDNRSALILSGDNTEERTVWEAVGRVRFWFNPLHGWQGIVSTERGSLFITPVTPKIEKQWKWIDASRDGFPVERPHLVASVQRAFVREVKAEAAARSTLFSGILQASKKLWE